MSGRVDPIHTPDHSIQQEEWKEAAAEMALPDIAFISTVSPFPLSLFIMILITFLYDLFP